jgi:hypothetical protein
MPMDKPNAAGWKTVLLEYAITQFNTAIPWEELVRFSDDY